MKTKKTTCRTTRNMDATIVKSDGGRMVVTVAGRNVDEAMGRAIRIFGLEKVVRVYDELTGDQWNSPLHNAAK